MTRDSADYGNTAFYQIRCRDSSITTTYIGHTVNFKIREQKHKSSCNNKKGPRYHLRVYRSIREHGGWENWEMILLEHRSCRGKAEAEERERELMFQYQTALNIAVPKRTPKEWYRDNATRLRERARIKYHTVEEIRQRKKAYNEARKEKMQEWRKQYDKSYYEKNKDKINERKKQNRESKKVEQQRLRNFLNEMD
jgi:hypothetical protein